jgi:hypothetical protein
MGGPARLLIVAMGIAIAAWWLVPAYIDAFAEAGRQVGNLHNGSAHARPADDTPRSHRRMECTGSIWSDKLQCGPWEDGAALRTGEGVGDGSAHLLRTSVPRRGVRAGRRKAGPRRSNQQRKGSSPRPQYPVGALEPPHWRSPEGRGGCLTSAAGAIPAPPSSIHTTFDA